MVNEKFNFFPIYKPKGVSSFDVVKKIKVITGVKKVGHAGTLDPLADGVLVVGVGGEATKALGQFVEDEKEYLVVICLGKTSTTDDDEGEKKTVLVKTPPASAKVGSVVKEFVGEIEQVPPFFSAVKVGGERSYRAARQGRKLELGPRNVLIKKIQILRYKYPFLELRVVTGKGVYIRSLARDIGEKLKTGGYVVELKRIRVGEFTLERALTLKKFAEVWREMLK